MADDKPNVIRFGTSDGDGRDDLVEKENAILYGRPVAFVVMPDGRQLPVYPKAQGYFYKIEEALNDYLYALALYDTRAARPPRWLRWLRGIVWRIRKRLLVDRIEQTKYRLLKLVFEDEYNEQRHVELTKNDFLSMPHDVIVSVFRAYREANRVDDILAILIEDFAQKKTDPQNALIREARASGMRQ